MVGRTLHHFNSLKNAISICINRKNTLCYLIPRTLDILHSSTQPIFARSMENKQIPSLDELLSKWHVPMSMLSETFLPSADPLGTSPSVDCSPQAAASRRLHTLCRPANAFRPKESYKIRTRLNSAFASVIPINSITSYHNS